MRCKKSVSKKMLVIFSVILSVIFMLSINNVSMAAEPIQIGLDGYVAEDGVLKLYVNHNQEDGFTVTKDNIKVMFGNNQMETQNIIAFPDSNVPISYKCVVDVSGSMSQERIDEAKAVIKDLANKKDPEDSIAITALGNELIQSEYMTDSAKIAEKADILTLTHEDTNLYYAIVQEIKGLQTADEVSRKKCLIIFSDGADDQATGITREEAENAVKDSHIPVFTVGLLKDKDNENSKEMAKILGSFARVSSGGVHFAPALGEGSVDTIADSILGVINRSFVFEESLENVNVSGKEVLLKVSVTTQEGNTAEDSINVPESDIKIIREEQKKIEAQMEKDEVEKEEPVEEKPIEEPVEKPTEEKTILGIPQTIFFTALAILVLIIILIIVILVKKRRKSDDEEIVAEPVEQPVENESVTAPVGQPVESESVTVPVGQPVGNESVTVPVEMNRTIGEIPNAGYTVALNEEKHRPEPSGKRYRVTLITIGKSTETKYDIVLYDSYTIGRSVSRCNLALPKDNALSGVHCTLLAQNGKIYIRDENSKNGTFVNGVPVSGKFELNQDDIILLGSYEYRIYWK